MYFPYLHGKRSELLALRDFAGFAGFDNTVCPIIEPVRHSFQELLTAVDILTGNGFTPVVIMNPSKLDFSNGMGNWYNDIMGSNLASRNWIPAMLVGNQHSVADVLNFANNFINRNVAVVYNSSNLSIHDFNLINNQANIVLQIVSPNSLNPQQRNCISANKAVDIVSCFNAQRRNADYNGPEFFSNQIHYYRNNAVGYGDFTVLPNEVSDDGGPPGAVAIHATFKEANSSNILVEHFVSTVTHQQQSNTTDKFLDAAGQLVTAVNSRPNEFGNNPALDSYRHQVSTSHFPGLGGNKRQQILHHICLNRQVLLGQI